MSHEFVAPNVIGTESNTKSCRVQLEGTFRAYQEIANKRYDEALEIAENIDTRMETSHSFNRNAVYAASLLAVACLRGAQVS